jgi:threonine dehydrogenase-like Zn-dependent dehydrogenase
MGSMFVQILKYRGATNIVVLEPIARKRQMVKSLGATHTFDPYDRNFDRNIKKLGIKFQLVIEACGKEDGVRECIDLLSKKT